MIPSVNVIYEGKIDEIGPITIAIGSSGLEKIGFCKADSRFKKRLTPGKWRISKFNRKIKSWLEGIINGRPKKFPYKLNLKGSKFQKTVWNTISKIPYGETRTYGWIAEQIGRPRAVRAVGNACGANPVPLVIPCHRVVASNGIGGFSSGIHLKKKLLNFERHT